MNRKKKIALLKKGIQVLEPTLKEETALLPVELAGGKKLSKKATEAVVKALPLDQLKKYGLMAGGLMLGLTALGSLYRAETYRMALARELKKQLAPINKKLDELETELRELILDTHKTL